MRYKFLLLESEKIGKYNMIEEMIKEADIVRNISTKNVKDSNLFLRRFYEEVSKYIEMGWNVQSWREGQTIFVGDSNFGSMMFDYKVKGQINNIYIKTKKKKYHSIIEKSLDVAIKEYNYFKKYLITIELDTQNFLFQTMCKNNIRIEPKYNEISRKSILISFFIKAFGTFDLRYIIKQKSHYLQQLLCAYTNNDFDIIRYNYCESEITSFEDSDWVRTNIDWIDDCFVEKENERYISLLPDFFDLFRIVLDNDSYERTMRLLLNSAQEIFCAKLMLNMSNKDAKYSIPGYTDIVNTVMISILEPLSNIGSKKPETCPACGNLKYKISQKIRDLCKRYTNEYLVKEITNIEYGLRSSFLHEGNARTNEFYCGVSVPLIDTLNQNRISDVTSYTRYNLFDWSTYIFRMVVHDLLNNIYENIILN